MSIKNEQHTGVGRNFSAPREPFLTSSSGLRSLDANRMAFQFQLNEISQLTAPRITGVNQAR